MTASALEPLVCIVDDDVSVRESVEGLFREEGFHVDMFDSAEGFLGRTRTDPPACLVVDLMLPGMSGLELHEELSRRGLDAPTILLTGHGDVATSVRAMKAGAIDFLTKPYDPDDLLAAVRQAVSRRFPDKTGTPRRIEGMVGESEVLRRVLSEVDLVGDTDATVLVTGESGTGKELVARAIHDRSRRRQGPMVRVNCAAISAARHPGTAGVDTGLAETLQAEAAHLARDDEPPAPDLQGALAALTRRPPALLAAI